MVDPKRLKPGDTIWYMGYGDDKPVPRHVSHAKVKMVYLSDGSKFDAKDFGGERFHHFPIDAYRWRLESIHRTMVEYNEDRKNAQERVNECEELIAKCEQKAAQVEAKIQELSRDQGA